MHTVYKDASSTSILEPEVLQVTMESAIATYDLIGKGDEKLADKLAVNAMRSRLNKMAIKGVVVIGEGERDQAPMLYVGEKVGSGKGLEVDIAVDPLEGTTLLAQGADNALSVLALTNRGGFLHAPDLYMDKIAIGFDYKEPIIDLDNSPLTNLKNLAKAKGCAIADLVVMILDRPRHQELIAKVREAGARIRLIRDGDIAAILATSNHQLLNLGVDVYMGIGGAPEGVLAAAALCCTGGQMQGRLLFSSQAEKDRAKTMGITDFSKKYNLTELASGDIIFAVTGATNGSLLKGVQKLPNGWLTHSLVMNSKAGTIRKVETISTGSF